MDFCWGLTMLLNISGHIVTVPAYGSGTLTDVLPHRNAMPFDTGHDYASRHSIQTQGQPVIVLSKDVEHHTGIHHYSILCLGQTRS